MFFDESARSIWDSLQDVEEMLDRMNRTYRIGRSAFGDATYPPVNVWANDDSVMVTAELPGIDPDSLSIQVLGENVVLSGKRAASSADEDKLAVHRAERPAIEFTRTLTLPFRVDPDQTEARCNRGILYLALRRPAEDKPKKIAVKAA
jgi:HSP20 family protein